MKFKQGTQKITAQNWVDDSLSFRVQGNTLTLCSDDGKPGDSFTLKFTRMIREEYVHEEVEVRYENEPTVLFSAIRVLWSTESGVADPADVIWTVDHMDIERSSADPTVAIGRMLAMTW